MMTLRSMVGLALTTLACACTVSSSDSTPVVIVPTTGSFTLDWTINGTKDPNACTALFADSIRITVFFVNGAPQGTYSQFCETFATSIPLDAGNYTADAVLVDTAGQPRTTTIQLAPFTILGNDQLTVPVDFPASSFF